MLSIIVFGYNTVLFVIEYYWEVCMNEAAIYLSLYKVGCICLAYIEYSIWMSFIFAIQLSCISIAISVKYQFYVYNHWKLWPFKPCKTLLYIALFLYDPSKFDTDCHLLYDMWQCVI